MAETSYDATHCSPLLQLPTGLQSVNPAWSTCVDTMEADDTGYVIDPPRALIPAAVLGPAQTKEASPTSAAAPVSLASHTLPLKTAPPSGSNAISGPKNDPPTGTNAAGNGSPEGKDPLVGDVPGNDPQAGQNLPYPNSGNVDPSKDSALANQQPGQFPAGGKFINNDPAEAGAPFTITVGGHVVQAASSANGILVDEQSIARGGSSITVSGTSIALHSNGDLMLGTLIAQTILPSLAPFITAVGGHLIQAAPFPGGILVDGHSVTRGGDPITVSGTPIALHSNGNLVLGTSTVPGFLSSLVPTSATVFTVGSQTLTLSSNSLIAAGTTLRPNDPDISIDGTIVSLGDSELQIGTNTIPLSHDTSILPITVITAAGQPFTILPNHVAIAGTTFTANAPAITLAGTPISFGADHLVVGTSTIPLPSLPPTSIITIAGQTYAISQAANGVSIAGTTIQLGQPAIRISGTPVALDSSALVIGGTSTIPYQSIVGVSPLSYGIGGFISAGLNGGLVPLPTTAGSTASNQTQKNTTGPAGGSVVFLGRGDRVQVPLYCPAAMTAIMLLMWFIVPGPFFSRQSW